MRAMAPDGLSDLLACVAAFGSSLGQSFDPTGVLAEFSARTQPVVPHDYMLIAVREDDGHTYSVFAEYAVRGSVGCDNKRYTTAFERGGRAAMDSFALAPVFGGEAERVADMASDDRLGDASAGRRTLDLALRAADGPGFERSGIIGVRRPGYATTPAVEDYSTLERVSRGEIILVRDARRELDPGRAGDRYLIESGDRSVLGVPLLFGEESGGGLFFVTAREHWYDESDVEVGTAIAAALVLAVQHQRLAEHQQR